MKRYILSTVLLLASFGVKAQDCREIVLPYFNYDTARMDQYPEPKLDFRCFYSQESFYESDTVPAGVDLFGIQEVADKFTGEHLPADYVVDLATLSYYRYTFSQFQMLYVDAGTTVCFSTPSSTHPYLVLRSMLEANGRAEKAVREKYRW